MLKTDHLTVAQAATLLDESRWTVARRIRAGELKAVKIGDGPTAAWMIRRSDVERLAKKLRGAA